MAEIENVALLCAVRVPTTPVGPGSGVRTLQSPSSIEVDNGVARRAFEIDLTQHRCEVEMIRLETLTDSKLWLSLPNYPRPPKTKPSAGSLTTSKANWCPRFIWN